MSPSGIHTNVFIKMNVSIEDNLPGSDAILVKPTPKITQAAQSLHSDIALHGIED